MKKRKFGKTNLETSEIGLGCWQLGGQAIINNTPTTYGNVNEELAIKIIKTAINNGVNVFDTADIYSLGNCERRLGKALEGNREQVYIFTKAAAIPAIGSNTPYEIDLSTNHLIAALNRSLQRLRTSYVDLFQVHTPPKSESDFINIEKTFSNIKKDGLSRYCGVSIGNAYEKGVELIERGIVDSIQLYFSLVNFEPLTNLLPLAKRNGVGVIVAQPLARGILSGKYESRQEFLSNDVRSLLDEKEVWKNIELAKKFKFLANESRTLSQIALAYVLERDEVSTCIPSAKTIEQLKMNIMSAEIKITSSELEKIVNIQEEQ